MQRAYGSEVPPGQFGDERSRVSSGLYQAQDVVPDPLLGIGAGAAGDLRELRLLLRCKADFHVSRIRYFPFTTEMVICEGYCWE